MSDGPEFFRGDDNNGYNISAELEFNELTQEYSGIEAYLDNNGEIFIAKIDSEGSNKPIFSDQLGNINAILESLDKNPSFIVIEIEEITISNVEVLMKNLKKIPGFGKVIFVTDSWNVSSFIEVANIESSDRFSKYKLSQRSEINFEYSPNVEEQTEP